MQCNGRRFALVLAAVLMGSAGAQAWGAATPFVFPGGAGNPVVSTAVAKGTFSCNVVFDISGLSQGEGFIAFPQFWGFVGTDLSAFIDLGSGSGLDQVCQTLAERIHSRARALGCTTTAMGTATTPGFPGSSFVWFFDFICVQEANRVIETAGALLTELMTAPGAQQSILRTVPQPLESNDPDALRTQLPGVRQKLFPAR